MGIRSLSPVVVGVLALSAALDYQGVRVGEFDVNVLLVDASEFPVEMISIFKFSDVESRRERGDMLETSLLLAGAVDIVVIQKAEDGSEFARRKAWEECHFFDLRARSSVL